MSLRYVEKKSRFAQGPDNTKGLSLSLTFHQNKYLIRKYKTKTVSLDSNFFNIFSTGFLFSGVNIGNIIHSNVI